MTADSLQWDNLLDGRCPKCGAPLVQDSPVNPLWYMCAAALGGSSCDFNQTAEAHDRNLRTLQMRKQKNRFDMEAFKKQYGIPDDYPEKQLLIEGPKPPKPTKKEVSFTLEQAEYIAETFLRYCIDAGVTYEYDRSQGGYNHRKGRVPDSAEFMDYLLKKHPRA